MIVGTEPINRSYLMTLQQVYAECARKWQRWDSTKKKTNIQTDGQTDREKNEPATARRQAIGKREFSVALTCCKAGVIKVLFSVCFNKKKITQEEKRIIFNFMRRIAIVSQVIFAANFYIKKISVISIFLVSILCLY